MVGKKRISSFFLYLFLFFSVLLILVELFLSLYGKTLCPVKGCEIASLMILVPKKYLLLFALSYFFLLLLLTIFYNYTKGPFFKDLLLFLGGSGIFAETIFLLRLFWDLGLICYFCIAVALCTLLTVFTLFLILLKEPLSYSSFFALFLGSLLGLIMTFIITGTYSYRAIPNFDRGYLIYSEECPQCQIFLKDPTFAHLKKVHVKEIYPLLKILNLSNLPVIIEKGEESIIIFTPQTDISICEPQPQGGQCVLP